MQHSNDPEVSPKGGGLWVPHPILAMMVSVLLFFAGATYTYFRQAASVEASVAVLTQKLSSIERDVIDLKSRDMTYRPASEMVTRAEWELWADSVKSSLNRIEQRLDRK